ncbi:MAG: hypothetical protein ACLR2O_08915 [Coprococcus sp.]
MEAYLQKGGKMMVILGDKEKGELPNLEAPMRTYGLEMADGYIAECPAELSGQLLLHFPGTVPGQRSFFRHFFGNGTGNQ